jgi:ribosomal subunit interface protein
MKKINIIPKNIELTKDIENYIEQKISYFEKFIDFNDDSFDCDFRVGKDSAGQKNGNIFFAETTIQTSGKVYGARADNLGTVEEAVDRLKDELKRKIVDHKNKKADLKRKGEAKNKEIMREN